MSDTVQSIIWYRLPFYYMKRLYDWVLHWAETPYGVLALFLIAFMESSFFPVPPDVLLIALCLGSRPKSFWFALVCTAGSIMGTFLGYYIGYVLWETLNLKTFFFKYVFSEEVFNIVVQKYQENAILTIFTAAFTPIPYKVFTIAAGVCKISLASLLVASIVGRAGRFFLVAILIYLFGPPIKRFIDRYFDLLAVVFTVLLVGGFVIVKKLM